MDSVVLGTLHKYSSGFVGCLSNVTLAADYSIDLIRKTATDGRNVRQCSDRRRRRRRVSLDTCRWYSREISVVANASCCSSITDCLTKLDQIQCCCLEDTNKSLLFSGLNVVGNNTTSASILVQHLAEKWKYLLTVLWETNAVNKTRDSDIFQNNIFYSR